MQTHGRAPPLADVDSFSDSFPIRLSRVHPDSHQARRGEDSSLAARMATVDDATIERAAKIFEGREHPAPFAAAAVFGRS